ncbi:hypothetical protein OS493_011247 [Desmophyllum pertusum]|uniref:Uncharacterized protein n=1 Tax=Desmophyllum pertusum TaxID=174260 RepID=A0A9W9Z1I9_9CNID|nr:hypothetical protein OS493_011247 [Desmophyllum pertusum]
MQTAEAGSSHGLVPTSMLGSSGQPLSVSESLSSRSVSANLNSSKQAVSSSLPEGNVTQTAVLPSGSPSTSSASEQKPASNMTLSVVMTTGSATSSFHLSPSQHANVTESPAVSITRSPSSAPLFVSITPSGTLTQSHVVLVPSSLSKESSVPQGNMTASLSVSNVVGIVTSTGVVPSTQVSLPTTSVSSSEQSSSVGMVVSSTFVVNETLPLTSSLDLKSSPSTLLSNSTSTLTHSVKSVSTSIQSSSTFGDNSTLPSTSSLDLMMSSAVLGKSSSILAHSTTAISQPSTVFGNASVAVSSSSLSPGTSSSFVVVVPSVSLGKDSSSLTQQPLDTSITISSSPLPTKIRNFSLSSTASSSSLSNMSVMSTALQSASDTSSLSIPPSSAHLSSPTTDLTSQAVSRSVVTRPSPSAVESSEVLQTIVSSSVTVASSSRLYRPPLVTISSLGICYVVYTTRIVQPSLVSTRPVNMSSTASVNVSSTRGFSVVMNTTSIQVSPSVSLNTSSAVVQPTLDVNATRSQSSRVLSTAVHVNFTVKPSGSSSSVQISLTVAIVNSTTSRPVSTSFATKSVEVTQSSNVSQSTSSASSSTNQIISVAFTTLPSVKETSSLATSTYLLSKTPSISTAEVLSSSQAPTSQVISPSRTVSPVVSSSTTVPTIQPPDPSLLMDTVLIVPQVMDVQSEEFRKELEVNLAEAYSFAELRRRKRATMDINATIDSIQRVNNGDNVNVAFFITKDDQRLSGFDAAQNYQKFSKAELGNLIKFDVVSMPRALVVPPTPPLQPNILVSLIIKASASGNISIPENKKRLEDNLAAFYKENKQLTTTVTANIKTIIHEPNEIDYLEFYISVSGQAVNASDVVQTFKVPHVNLLSAQLEVEVLVQAYIQTRSRPLKRITSS